MLDIEFKYISFVVMFEGTYTICACQYKQDRYAGYVGRTDIGNYKFYYQMVYLWDRDCKSSIIIVTLVMRFILI